LSLEEERLDQCDGSCAKEMLMFLLDLEEEKIISVHVTLLVLVEQNE
jgi:hypothetical protein